MALCILEGQAKCRVKSGLHLKWDSLGSQGGKLQKIDRQVKKRRGRVLPAWTKVETRFKGGREQQRDQEREKKNVSLVGLKH